jgi:hypothetical protein
MGTALLRLAVVFPQVPTLPCQLGFLVWQQRPSALISQGRTRLARYTVLTSVMASVCIVSINL